jgi:hypothetical protein
MLIDWSKFIPALLLLLTPVALFHGRKVRFRAVSRDWDRHWVPVLSLGLHTIDFLRALLGTWLLGQALTRVAGAHGLAGQAVLITQAVVLCVAVTLQATICKEEDAINAPFTFVTGLIFGFLPPTIAGFGVLLAVVITAGLRSPEAYFPLVGIATVASGFLFSGRSMLLSLAIMFLAAFLPFLVSILFSRHMVISYRARRSDETRPPVPTDVWR